MKRRDLRARNTFLAVALSAAIVGALFPALPAVAAPAIQLVNPSGYSPTLRISDKEDDENTYHLVAWVAEVPANPFVEFELATPATGLATVTGVQVATDTWAADFNIPDTVPDGQYLLRAILYSGQDDQATDTQTITVQSNPNVKPAETVEMTYPANGGGLGFFTPTGGRGAAVLEGIVSSAAARVRALYSITDPGKEPVWEPCGSGVPDDNNEVRARCTLVDDGPATRVRAVALVANNTPPPGEAFAAGDETGDAHRVIPYSQTPTGLQFDPETEKVDPGSCALVKISVFDQSAQEIVGANVDVHATGPDDQLRFGSSRGSTSAFQAPDKVHTGSEPTVKCAPTDEDNSQGEHNVPASPDQKHIESRSGTGVDGSFTFALRSESKGGTLIQAWADVDGDDAQAPGEASGGAQLGWGTAPPEPQRTIILDPQFASPERGSCQSFTVTVKQGGQPLGSRNVDIHVKDPAGVGFCAPPGNAVRPPDDGDHSGGQDEDGTLHAEGETNSSGQLVFGATSAEKGLTNITVWLDEDDDDDFDDDESSTSGQASWGGQTRTVSTSVSARYRKPVWKGTVKSAEASCKAERTVTLKRKKQGRDPVIGSDTSSQSGAWTIRKRSKRGRYYVIVAAKRFVNGSGDTIVCSRGKSRTKRVR